MIVKMSQAPGSSTKDYKKSYSYTPNIILQKFTEKLLTKFYAFMKFKKVFKKKETHLVSKVLNLFLAKIFM